MKVYIIFTAFLLVFSMFLVYTADINKYIQLQKQLKDLAEECAEAGALSIDEESEIIDPEIAKGAAENILKKSNSFQEEAVMIESCTVTAEGRGFEVTLVYQNSSLFRLTFISLDSVKRTSEYVWE